MNRFLPETLRRAAPAALALLVGTGTGCMRQADSTVPEEAQAVPPRRGGEFHLMIEPPGTFDPPFVDDVYEACVVNQLYDGLLEFDVHLNPVPAIAREWSVSRDGLEYVFHLRDDVRFHNGRRVVASDVVFSFTRIFGPGRTDFGIGGAYLRKIEGVDDFVAGRAAAIRGLVARDDTTLSIRLQAPYGSFLSALAMDQAKVVPREEIGNGGREARPCGTGPFVWVGTVDDPADPRLVLRANDSFRHGRPHLDEIVFHVPRDYNVDLAAEALVAERVTMCDMPGTWRARIESDPRFRIVRRPELSFSFVGFHVGMPPLDDVRIRRAVAHAIDRARIAGVDPFGRIAAVGILPPGMFGYSPQDKGLAYDPDAARELLASAGHPGGAGLAPLVYHQANRGEAGKATDAILRENLEAVGLRVEFRYPEWDRFSDDIDAGRLPTLGLTWVADVPDPDSFLASLFLTDGAYNMFSYSNRVVDSLLAQGSRMRGSRERAEVYRRAERLILDDVPVIPLFNVENAFAVRAEVRDLLITPFGLGNLSMERIWLDSPAS
jgi:peptide/nickel transport system substrate-binding protein/oligopeptide transport system substrate-binding protein